MMRLPRACCLAGGDDLLVAELMEGGEVTVHFCLDCFKVSLSP